MTDKIRFTDKAIKTSAVTNDRLLLLDSEDLVDGIMDVKSIRISDLTLGGTGEINDGNNLGSTGFGLYTGKTNETLNFKRLLAGERCSISSFSNYLSINVDPFPNVVGANKSTPGAGEGVYDGKSGDVLSFKRIKAGNGIDVTSDANSVIVSLDDSPSPFPESEYTKTMEVFAYDVSEDTKLFVDIADGTPNDRILVPDNSLVFYELKVNYVETQSPEGNHALPTNNNVNYFKNFIVRGQIFSKNGTVYQTLNSSPYTQQEVDSTYGYGIINGGIQLYFDSYDDLGFRIGLVDDGVTPCWANGILQFVILPFGEPGFPSFEEPHFCPACSASGSSGFTVDNTDINGDGSCDARDKI